MGSSVVEREKEVRSEEGRENGFRVGRVGCGWRKEVGVLLVCGVVEREPGLDCDCVCVDDGVASSVFVRCNGEFASRFFLRWLGLRSCFCLTSHAA